MPATDRPTTVTAGRLNFRVRHETEQRLRAAAAATDRSLTDFVIAAAESRADEVLATHTVVPAAYFDDLLAALDRPAERIDTLAEANRKRRRFKQG